MIDQRPFAERPEPAHNPTEEERDKIIETYISAEFGSLPPSQIVPKLADKCMYIGSEATCYRVLHEEGLLHQRGRAKKREKLTGKPNLLAEGPNDVWTYDVTYLPSRVRGQFFYLYMIQDLDSRYGIHWDVHDTEHADHNANLIQQATLKVGHSQKPRILHSDNGSCMKSMTMRKKLVQLGITPSFSRPSVSNDNAFIESMFRTVKYCPQWPSSGFATLEEARKWVEKFMHWYNTQHQHSGLNFVTPEQRYAGLDVEILAKRKAVYEAAKAKNPRRWSREIRDWSPVGQSGINTKNTNPDKRTVELKKAG